ncbi:hypothetical protein EDF54_0104 [Rathayibacter sp. PhB93]|uniref:hypothetical protein n=1 Tax=unclassified Rathayibacter TaxID=2609250 RepID=UPI000F4A84EF|nr:MULTISPECIES: hypothetical protein [unclassified Rathayibacter]ROQ16982.1 hypothetical protein EDF54_0104 [Rathayibacter sp. PhB93]TDQ06802.1 hypothetical protein EDF17_3796 [Rathayibacter sp. PhB1]
MVLPLIPLVIIVATAVTGAGGGAVGVWGGAQIKQAKADMKAHAAKYAGRHDQHLAEVQKTNDALQELGRSQYRAQEEVIFRMRAFLERNARQVRAHEHLILDGLDGTEKPVVGLTRLDRDLAGWVRGVVGSTIAGVATPVAMRMGVTTLATAGTGTAISGLSGAAATSATMAWLGGGALAAGGGGMALGAVMLNVAIVGPSLLLAGITVKNRGTKAKTDAAIHQTEIDIEIARLNERDELLQALQTRAQEIDAILIRLIEQTVDAIDVLESEPFDADMHAKRFQAAVILVTAVRGVATAPIADENGALDEQTGELVFTYRRQEKECDHG